MATCASCGSTIPGPYKFCSMCYGDPNYGNDGIMEAAMRLQDQEVAMRRQQEGDMEQRQIDEAQQQEPEPE